VAIVRRTAADDVIGAFARHGYVLVGRDASGATVAGSDGHLLTPRGGQPFIAIVLSTGEADEAWSVCESERTSESFDARRRRVW